MAKLAQEAIVTLLSSGISSTTAAAISSEAVAAGDGALQM
jgi:hypothetical protein